MKKIVLLICISICMAACRSHISIRNNDTTTTETQNAVMHDQGADTNATKTGAGRGAITAQDGIKLLAESDCMTCHSTRVLIVGPSFKDIANKYTTDTLTINMLTDKVIKGGKGNWGDVPMPAHANLSKADVVQMVKYILSLK